ncbi:MAG: HAMP domain-containing protein, partial [bacterium]
MTIIMLLLVLVVSAISIWSVQQVGKGGEIIMNASSYNCMIHNLRLSFEKVLMPPHDYLIYSDPKEIHEFESALKELKQHLVQVTDVIRISERKVADGRERHLAIAREGIVKIEAIAHDILSISDPLGIESARLMKEMDASTEHVKQALRELIQVGSRDEQSQAFHPVYEFMISFQSVLMPPHDYLIMGNETERENYRMLLESLVSRMDEIFKLSKPSPEKQVIERIKTHFKGVTDLASQILAIEDPLKFQGAAKMKQMDFIADQVVMEMETLMEYYKNDAKSAKEMADRTKNASIRFTLLISLLLVIGGLIGGLLFSFHITNPVRQLLQATKNISAGDLTHKAHVKSRDEIGELAESFNQMTADLRTYQAQLIHTKEYINNIIKSMIDTLIVVDPDNTIRTVNQAALKMLNYDREEDLVGRPVET